MSNAPFTSANHHLDELSGAVGRASTLHEARGRAVAAVEQMKRDLREGFIAPSVVEDKIDDALTLAGFDDDARDQIMSEVSYKLVDATIREVQRADEQAAARPLNESLDEWDAGDDPGPIPPRQWHHVHKGTLTPGDADAGRGSSGIRDAARLIYTLAPMSEDEARMYGIAPDDSWSYVRLDSAKVNIAARSAKPTWFRLIGVPIGNGTPEYPNGDTIQVVKPWTPPDTWAGVSPVTLNAVLDEIDGGLPSRQRFSADGGAKDRAAWPVVARHCPTKSEGQAREIIRTWLKTGVLYVADYDDPVDRKPRKGLHVDATKRPSI